jgi:dTDP-4-dehydrorhamnose reductase
VKNLIVGIESQIGRALADFLRQEGAEIYGTSRRGEHGNGISQLDLADLDGLKRLPACDVAFLCAAETRLAACRNDPLGTARINVAAPVTIARHLVGEGCFVIFLSTNAVFDGSVPHCQANAPTCPVTPYGEQKAKAEQQLLELNHDVAVLRLTKVLTANRTLLKEWLHTLERGQTISPFYDMVMAPIPLLFVTEALASIAKLRAKGIFQASASRDVSYADVARHIASRSGHSLSLVRPISAVEAGIPTGDMPRHTTLDASRLETLMKRPMPDPLHVVEQALHLDPTRLASA